MKIRRITALGAMTAAAAVTVAALGNTPAGAYPSMECRRLYVASDRYARWMSEATTYEAWEWAYIGWEVTEASLADHGC